MPLANGTTWECNAQLQAGRGYLLRAEDQVFDIALEVASAERSLVTVDAPTRRAGPELLFFVPPATASYSIRVRVQERSTEGRVLELLIQPIDEATPGSPVAEGLTALTAASALTDSVTPADAERRIGLLRKAHESLQTAGKKELAAQALFRIAGIRFWVNGDWARSIEAAIEAGRAFEALGAPLMAAQADVIRAASLIETANSARRAAGRSTAASARRPFAQAERLLHQAADRFRAAGMKYDEAHALNNIGIALHYQGQFETARSYYTRAARIFSEAREASSEALPLQNIAALDYERGDYARAEESYQRVLRSLHVEEDPSTHIAILNNLGNAQIVQGKLEAALETILTALQTAQTHKLKREQAESLDSLGELYLSVGDYERATVFLEQTLALRRSIDDRRGLRKVLVKLGDLYRERGDPRRALELHIEALEKAVSNAEKGQVLLAVGRDHIAADSIGPALAALRAARALDLPQDWPTRTSIDSAYGYALLRSGQSEGRELMLDSIATHRARGRYDRAAQAAYRLAAEEHRQGHIEPALKHVESAIELFHAQRVRAVNPEMRATYIASRAAAFELQAELYMTLAERSTDPARAVQLREKALLASEARRVRTLEDFTLLAPRPSESRDEDRELLARDQQLAARRHRLARLMEQQNPSPEAVTRLQSEIGLIHARLDLLESSRRGEAARTAIPPQRLADVQKRLPADALILTYLIGGERSWLWCLTRDATKVYPLPGREALENSAQELYDLWSRPVRIDVQRELAASQTLIGPAVADIRAKRHIVVIPDGALRFVPFAALRVSEPGMSEGVRLIERHAVSYRPALTDFNGTDTVPSTVADRILLIGDPEVSRAPSSGDDLLGSQTPPPLPGARREIASIASLASDWNPDVLVGAQATKMALLGRPLNSYRALHFATHARMDPQDPALSAITLATPAGGSRFVQSDLTLREIVGLDLNAEVVVLSACEGSAGKQYRGQLAFGLSEAFLIAGARAVLGGLWRVSDAAAHTYMQTFYDAWLRGGEAPVDAARAAARSMSGDRTFGHPYFWAPFVLLERGAREWHPPRIVDAAKGAEE